MRSEAQHVDWEEYFPGESGIIRRVLEPFYEWKPEFKRTLPDIEERAKAAIFWMDYRGVRVYRVSDVGALWESLKNPLRVPLMCHSSRQSLMTTYLASLRMWYLWCWLRGPLWESLKMQLFGSDIHMIWMSYRVSDDGPPHGSFLPFFWSSLQDPLICQCGFLLADKPEEAAKFQPLLNLWLEGNFPVGFDIEGRLVVLTAD